MSYRDIPDKFQPTEIANNRYYFPDGVYSLERDRLVVVDRAFPQQQEQFPLVLTLNLVAVDDDTPEGQVVPRYINGVRRVRNICVDLDLFMRSTSSASSFMQSVLDIIVIRQGQVQAFDCDVLATRSSTSRIFSSTSNDAETYSLCYPGYVDLNGGDSVLVRLSVSTPNNAAIAYTTAISASALVRFA